MLDLAAVIKALEALLSADATIGNWKIARGEYINRDPNHTPWVGLYKGTQSLSPLSLGANSKKWADEPTIVLIVQASDLETGSNCEDKLESYKKSVLTLLNANPTISGTVQTILGYEISYSYNREERSTIYFQEAIITVNLRTKSGG